MKLNDDEQDKLHKFNYCKINYFIIILFLEPPIFILFIKVLVNLYNKNNINVLS